MSVASRDEGNRRARGGKREVVDETSCWVKGLRRRDRRSRVRLRVVVIGDDGRVRLQKMGTKVHGIAIFIVGM